MRLKLRHIFQDETDLFTKIFETETCFDQNLLDLYQYSKKMEKSRYEMSHSGSIKGRCQKKPFFFGTLSQTMGRWGSKVPNSLVKTTIQSFLLQTPRNVPKYAIRGWVGVQSPKQIHGILSEKFLIFSKK